MDERVAELVHSKLMDVLQQTDQPMSALVFSVSTNNDIDAISPDGLNMFIRYDPSKAGILLHEEPVKPCAILYSALQGTRDD